MQTNNQVEPLISTADVATWLIVLVIVTLFVSIFAFVYVLVCFLTSARGWRGYAARYPGDAEPPVGMNVQRGQSMMVGGNVAPANYRHVVTVGYDGEGIYLKMASIFGLFHSPIFLPWTKVQSVSQKPAIKGVYTAVENRNLPRLVFFKSLGDQIYAAWQSRESEASAANA